jgi:tRNA(Ser,Leu) C12 N-acetylase TAN1
MPNHAEVSEQEAYHRVRAYERKVEQKLDKLEAEIKELKERAQEMNKNVK